MYKIMLRWTTLNSASYSNCSEPVYIQLCSSSTKKPLLVFQKATASSSKHQRSTTIYINCSTELIDLCVVTVKGAHDRKQHTPGPPIVSFPADFSPSVGKSTSGKLPIAFRSLLRFGSLVVYVSRIHCLRHVVHCTCTHVDGTLRDVTR